MTTNITPDAIDVHVGARIRDRRKAMALSQTALADHLDLTFQQVQKYERGANRISASMLYKTAAKLEVGVGFFFEGLDGYAIDAQADDGDVQAFLYSADGRDALRKLASMDADALHLCMDLADAVQKAMAPRQKSGVSVVGAAIEHRPN